MAVKGQLQKDQRDCMIAIAVSSQEECHQMKTELMRFHVFLSVHNRLSARNFLCSPQSQHLGLPNIGFGSPQRPNNATLLHHKMTD